MSHSLVLIVWKERGLRPWRTRSFRYSTDPDIVAKVRDVVGTYAAARHGRRAPIVLCVDEKPSIQALSRTAPILPMRPGLIEGRSADYLRHGTSDLRVKKSQETSIRCLNVTIAGQWRHIVEPTLIVALTRRTPPGVQILREWRLDADDVGRRSFYAAFVGLRSFAQGRFQTYVAHRAGQG